MSNTWNYARIGGTSGLRSESTPPRGHPQRARACVFASAEHGRSSWAYLRVHGPRQRLHRVPTRQAGRHQEQARRIHRLRAGDRTREGGSLTAHPEPHPEPHCHPTLTLTLASTLNTPPSPSRSPSPLALTLTLDPAPSPRALTLALALPKVELIGLPEEVDLARLCIQITLQQRKGSGAPAVVYSDLERREDVTVLDVPEKCVGFILGAKGATLRQARVRARVRARARARARARVGMRTRETATGDCVHDQAQSVHSLHVHCICMCTVALRCARWR